MDEHESQTGTHCTISTHHAAGDPASGSERTRPQVPRDCNWRIGTVPSWLLTDPLVCGHSDADGQTRVSDPTGLHVPSVHATAVILRAIRTRTEVKSEDCNWRIRTLLPSPAAHRCPLVCRLAATLMDKHESQTPQACTCPLYALHCCDRAVSNSHETSESEDRRFGAKLCHRSRHRCLLVCGLRALMDKHESPDPTGLHCPSVRATAVILSSIERARDLRGRKPPLAHKLRYRSCHRCLLVCGLRRR
jgi:hypothetical protein